jgi:hypothetical protein
MPAVNEHHPLNSQKRGLAARRTSRYNTITGPLTVAALVFPNTFTDDIVGMTQAQIARGGAGAFVGHIQEMWGRSAASRHQGMFAALYLLFVFWQNCPDELMPMSEQRARQIMHQARRSSRHLISRTQSRALDRLR